MNSPAVSRVLRMLSLFFLMGSGISAQEVTLFPPVLIKPDGSREVLVAPTKMWKVKYPKERLAENEIGSGFLVGYVGPGGIELEVGRGAERAYAQAVHDTADNGLGKLEKKWAQEGFGYVWRAAIFNPPSARVDGPEATPRLLEIEPVFLPNHLMAAGKFDISRRFRMARIAIDTDGSVARVTMLGDKRLSGEGHHKRDREPMELTSEVQQAIEAVVKRWRFEPARKAGVPVKAEVLMKVPIWVNPQELFTARELAPELSIESQFARARPSVVKRLGVGEGTVEMEFVVDPEGKVRVPRVVSRTHPELEKLAEKLLERWQFKVVQREGAPASLKLRHTFYFSSEEGDFLRLADFEDNALPPRRTSPWRIQFPEEMAATATGAMVIAEVEIDARGRPRNPVILQSTHPLYNEAMIDGILRTDFAPGRRNGVPAEVRALVAVKFSSSEGHMDYSELEEPSEKDYAKVPPQLRFEQQPKAMNVAMPVHPYALLKANAEGAATVVVMVNEKGEVSATHVASCTQAEFGQALAAACELYTFKPGLRNGRAAAGPIRVDHTFSLTEDHPATRFVRMERKGGKGIVDSPALDRPLKVVSQAAPSFPLSLLRRPVAGSVVVEALVDGSGRVQLPRVVSADEPAFGYAAVQAVSAWRFEPPVSGGSEVVVRVRIPFKFAPPSAQKSEAAAKM